MACCLPQLSPGLLLLISGKTLTNKIVVCMLQLLSSFPLCFSAEDVQVKIQLQLSALGGSPCVMELDNSWAALKEAVNGAVSVFCPLLALFLDGC